MKKKELKKCTECGIKILKGKYCKPCSYDVKIKQQREYEKS